MTFTSVQQALRANKDLGQFWFSPDTQRFFQAKIETNLIDGKYWIESTRNYDDSAREYKLVECQPNGDINYVAPTKAYATLDAASAALGRLIVKEKT